MISNFLKCVVIDVASGIYIYVFVSLLFGQSFHFSDLGISIFFVLAPDLDFIPFVACNKYIFRWLGIKFRFASHHFIHFPRVFLPVSMAVGFGLADFYGATLALLCGLAHFTHDSLKPPEEMSGIQWGRFLFWGSRDLYFFHKGKLQKLPYEKWKEHLNKKREGAATRSASDEVKARADSFGLEAKMYVVASLLFLIAFYVRSI
ncbi:MAG: hypothetical protein NT170_04655 [Candidatus Moranbacteria bacterium]|nr:hypothetical protein [Candidatus Moranbacteria bacterium]